MSRPDSVLPDDLAAKLAGLESQVKTLVVLRGCGLTCLVLLGGIAAGMLIDLFWELTTAVRLGILCVVIAATAVTFWRTVLRLSMARFPEAVLAALVEQAHPDLRERLTSAVELSDPAIPEAHKGSTLMREMLHREAFRATAPLSFSDSVSSDRTIRIVFAAVMVLVVFMVPFVFAPSGTSLLLSRFFVPWGNFDRVGEFAFDIRNGDRTVARGVDVSIEATPQGDGARGALPEAIWLNWSDTAGNTNRRRMVFDEADRSFGTVLRRVVGSFDYDVSAGRSRSRRFRVTVVDPPVMTRTMLHIDPPGYTGMPARTVDGALGETAVLERSRLAFDLAFNKPVFRAEIEWLAPPTVAPAAAPADESLTERAGHIVPFVLSEDRQSASLGMQALAGGPFLIRVTDDHGLQNAEEPERRLVILKDRAPVLELGGSEESQQARPDDIVPIPVDVFDDIGVGAVELHYEVFQGKGDSESADAAGLGTRTVSHEFQFDLSSLNLTHGSVLTYRVRATDERPVPGPNEAWSERRVVTIDRNAVPPETGLVTERQRQARSQLEQIREAVAGNRERVTELQAAAEGHDGNSEFERNDEIPPLAQDQMELAERLERLADRLAEHPLFANLAPEAQELARQDLPDTSRALKQAAQQAMEEKTGTLEETVERLARAESELRSMETQFDELAALERDLLELNRLARQARQLSGTTADLDQRWRDALAESSPQHQQEQQQQLAEERQQLAREQQQLTDQLDDLLERRPEVVDAARQHALDRLGELAQRALDIAEPQDRLAEALKAESQAASDDASAGEPAPQDASDNASASEPPPQAASDDASSSEPPPQATASSEEQPASRTQDVQNEEDAQQQNEGLSRADDTLTRQQTLTRQAARLALEVARQEGPESKAAQNAAEMLRLSGG